MAGRTSNEGHMIGATCLGWGAVQRQKNKRIRASGRKNRPQKIREEEQEEETQSVSRCLTTSQEHQQKKYQQQDARASRSKPPVYKTQSEKSKNKKLKNIGRVHVEIYAALSATSARTKTY